ncbi:MAG: NAD-dependent epimerase/dehydratase family protein [Deltaproteobacteria bacterium]|nr:NAD-dependent epimerase/dehydratase family protein [Deltaproteobacteria bacterium]
MNGKRRFLVTGAVGQIGSELTHALRRHYGAEQVVATDIRLPTDPALRDAGPFEFLDCLDPNHITRVMQRYETDVIYHLGAILSAIGELKPGQAWQINVEGTYNMLEAARQYGCAIFFPSSIGAFGPETPRDDTPQVTIQRPNTMYGVTKVTGELLCDYYHQRFDVDVRGLRFPGLISHETEPGGGTTDYAVDIYRQAVEHAGYISYLGPDTRLPMMYMPDAIRAMIELMEADPARLVHRNAYNLAAMSFTPEEVAAEIAKHIPSFEIRYRIDPTRQAIADSWPRSIDDSAARAEWGWKPRYDLTSMTEEMLRSLQANLEHSQS